MRRQFRPRHLLYLPFTQSICLIAFCYIAFFILFAIYGSLFFTTLPYSAFYDHSAANFRDLDRDTANEAAASR